MNKKRKPRVFNWIVRGYKDAMKNTPFKHAPAKDIDKIPRDKWTPEIEQYFDGFNSAKKDLEEGLIETKSN